MNRKWDKRLKEKLKKLNDLGKERRNNDGFDRGRFQYG